MTMITLAKNENAALYAARYAAAALTVAPLFFGGAKAQTLNVDTLNNDLKSSLTAGRDAGKKLTCSATMVFFDSTFMKFVFGLMLLASIAMAVYAWWSQSRNGVGMGRIFWLIVIVMAATALIATITTTFMGCNA